MKTIMIVDDDPDIRKTVKTVLEKHKYKVSTAVNADDCLKKLKKAKPDLILLDIMMPGMSVKDLLKKVKTTDIAFLTIVKMTEAEKDELLKNKNIKDFIEKPFDVDNLAKRVKKITG